MTKYFSNRRRQPSGSSLSSLGLPVSLSPSPVPPDSPFASPKVQRHDRQHTQGKILNLDNGHNASNV